MIGRVSRGEQARAQILDAAEQLIAERGVQVPLRDIATAAGQRNNSAVHYHFRSREELLDAVVRRRLEPMEAQRSLMLSALDAEQQGDVDALLRIMVLPMMAVDSHFYARFLQVSASHLRIDVEEAQGSVWALVLDRLMAAIPTTDRRACRRRVNAVATTMFALLAQRERLAQSDIDSVGSPEEIIAMLAAMLTAPFPPVVT